MKKDLLFVLIIAVIVSSLSLVTMLKNSSTPSLQSYAGNFECKAQGDFKPEPFDNLLLSPFEVNSDPICNNQIKA